MNFKTTLVLVVLALGVGLFFVINGGSFSVSSPPPAPMSTGTPLPLPVKLQPDDVNKITIRKGAKTVVLERKGQDWRETEPVLFPVDGYHVTDIARAALSLAYVQQFEPGAAGTPGLGDIGLKPAKATVTLSGKAGEVTLQVGQASIGGHGYVSVKGDSKVYVVSDNLQQAVLEQSDHDWRTRSLSAPKASEADAVVIQHGSETIHLAKHDGDWYLGQNGDQRASAKAVGALLDAVRGMSIDKFVADKPKDMSMFGLKHPDLVVTIRKPVVTDDAAATQKSPTKPKEKTYTLRFGAPASMKGDKYFATYSDSSSSSSVVFTVSESDRKGVDKSANDLRDPRVMTSKADQVQELTIERDGKQTIHLVKSDNAFSFAKPKPDFDLDYQAGHQLIKDLTSLKASGYTANFKPEAKPVATLRVQPTGVSRGEKIRIYKDAKSGGYLSVRNDEPVAYHLTAKDAAPIFEPRLALRDKNVINLAAKDIAGLSLRRDDGVRFVFSRQAAAASQPAGAAAGWKLQGHAQCDAAAIKGLLEQLHPLRIETWLASAVKPGKGWIQLTVTPRKGPAKVLHVDPDNRHAVISGIDTGFVITPDTLNQLEAEYRQRTLVSLSMDDLSQIEVLDAASSNGIKSVAALNASLAAYKPDAARHTGLVVERGSGANYTTPGSAKIDQAAAASVFDTISGLAVKRFTPDHQLAPIARRIRVTTASGETFEIVCFKGDNHRAFIHGKMSGKRIDRWFTLASDDFNSLMRGLVKTGGSAGAGPS